MGLPKGRVLGPRGEPLLVGVASAASTIGEVALVGNATDYDDLLPGCVRLGDAATGVGPLGGLVALLRAAGSRQAIALACDLPDVRSDDVRALATHPSTAAIVAARRCEDAPFEPLFARYDPARVLHAAEAQLAEESHSLQRLLRACEATWFIPRPEAIGDWDDPADVARGGGRMPG